MFSPRVVALFLVVATSLFAQGGLEQTLTGKEVTVKIDMPGTQKGVELHFSGSSVMDWNENAKRLREFGTSIRKGDTARITAVVVKNDRIELQLNGGGFGKFLDNANTSVEAKVTAKSDYEKTLESQISTETDPNKKRDLQRDFDRERARREHQDEINNREAREQSAKRKQEVAENRAAGGSRFNLRWSGRIPEEDLTPDGIAKLLADYVSFDLAAAPAPGEHASTEAAAADEVAPTARLHRGMSMDEVAGLLGQGKQVAHSEENGMKTDVLGYTTGDRNVEVTYVNGVVVRYAIASK